ncbi:hypothetical protein [Sinorhizobium sp. P24N7]|uniref:hypothetical protein n=1 Tax=Sinorhizobium sp. P24N7 TaxID=3348358 RepID=UPI0036D2B486
MEDADADFEIACSKCGLRAKRSIFQLKYAETFKCNACGSTRALDKENLKELMREADAKTRRLWIDGKPS